MTVIERLSQLSRPGWRSKVSVDLRDTSPEASRDMRSKSDRSCQS